METFGMLFSEVFGKGLCSITKKYLRLVEIKKIMGSSNNSIF